MRGTNIGAIINGNVTNVARKKFLLLMIAHASRKINIYIKNNKKIVESNS